MIPKILITPNFENNQIMINENYVKSIENVNGIPILATYSNNKNIDEYLKICDGVLFSGGGDINTEIINVRSNSYNEPVPLIRDEFEISILKKCIERDIPILCICRGIQVLNVAMGGTIFQHIEGHNGNKEELHHKILIKRDSKLFNAVKDIEIKVNSVHHQAINKLGKGLKITAFSNDGYIEAVESINNTFVVGVQWHPEYLIKCEEQLNIFKEFIKFCTIN